MTGIWVLPLITNWPNADKESYYSHFNISVRYMRKLLLIGPKDCCMCAFLPKLLPLMYDCVYESYFARKKVTIFARCTTCFFVTPCWQHFSLFCVVLVKIYKALWSAWTLNIVFRYYFNDQLFSALTKKCWTKKYTLVVILSSVVKVLKNIFSSVILHFMNWKRINMKYLFGLKSLSVFLLFCNFSRILLHRFLTKINSMTE